MGEAGGGSTKATICWKCANAVPSESTGCNWSRDFQPVDGWEALQTQMAIYAKCGGKKNKRFHITSYRVKRCPEFIRG